MPSDASAPTGIASTAGLAWVRAIVCVSAPLSASGLIPMALGVSATVWSPIEENAQSAPTRLYPFDAAATPVQLPPAFPALIELAKEADP